MKKMAIALALALTLTGTLTACGGNDTKPNSSSNGSMSGSSVTQGQVSRRYDRNTTGYAGDYLDAARYSAGTNGKVYGGDGNTVTRDLTQGARDLMRGAGNAVGDVGRGVGNAVGDMARGAGDAARDIGNGVGSAAKDMGRGMTGKY